MAPTKSQSSNKLLVGVLTNPLSGKNRQSTSIFAEMMSEYPEVAHLNVQTPGDVHAALVELSRRRIDILVINGGDGTVQAVLTTLRHHQPFAVQPQLVVLAGGTTNMIAGDVGVSGNRMKVLQRLVLWIQTGSGRITRVQRPVLRLDVPGHEIKYGMFFGAAGISRGIQYYQKNMHNKIFRGFPGICITVVHYLWRIVCHRNKFAAASQITVIVNGRQPQKQEYILLFVSTLERLFFGLHPFWGTENGPLRFTAVSSKARYLLRVLPFLATGRCRDKGIPANGYYSSNLNSVELYTAESVALDGEIYAPESDQQPISLQNGGYINFLQL